MSQTTSDHAHRPILFAIIARPTAACRALVAEMRNRRAVARSMGGLSAQQLRDIGLTRDDLDAARSAPLSQDLSAQLCIKAQHGSSNW